MDKLNSSRMAEKKGSVAVIEYHLLQAATNNFQEVNVLGEGGRGCLYKACFSEKLLAAVRRFEGEEQDIEREFEVTSYMKLIWLSIVLNHYGFFNFFPFHLNFVCKCRTS